MKAIKSVILYYYIAGIVFAGLIIAAAFMDPADTMGYSILSLYIILPISSIVFGFLVGGARSYAKWGFPIYMALLTFCLEILVFASEDWMFILLAFGLSLGFVAIRHAIKARRRKNK